MALKRKLHLEYASSGPQRQTRSREDSITVLSSLSSSSSPSNIKEKYSQLPPALTLSGREPSQDSGFDEPLVCSFWPNPDLQEVVELEVKHPHILNLVYAWIAERSLVFDRRASGAPAPWSCDDKMGRRRFCDVFRVRDRNTQFLIERVLPAGPQTLRELFFRVLLYRIFNRISTWELLVKKLCTKSQPHLTWASFNFTQYRAVLDEAKEEGTVLFTGAYQVNAPKWLPGAGCAANNLLLVQAVLESDIPERVEKCRYMVDAFYLLKEFPVLQDFIGYQ
jgi:hypothetical protein